jgi:hypothetical protein
MNYMESLAQRIRDSLDPDLVPEGDTDSLFLSYAVLAKTKGDTVTNADVHDAWVAWMTSIDPAHESLIPYEELPADTRTEDSPFAAAIRSVSAEDSDAS